VQVKARLVFDNMSTFSGVPPQVPPAPRSGNNNSTSSSVSTVGTSNISNSNTGMVQRTGAAEGFYRRNWQQQAQHSALTVTTAITVQEADESPHETANDTIHRRRSLSAPVRPETMNERHAVESTDDNVAVSTAYSPSRSSSAAVTAVTAGALRPPGELGIVSVHSSTSGNGGGAGVGEDEVDNPHLMRSHPRIRATRKQWLAAAARGHARDQQVPVSSQPVSVLPPPQPSVLGNLVTTMCYGGMEVTLVSTKASKNSEATTPAVYVLCTRTRLVFQRLDVSRGLVGAAATIDNIDDDNTATTESNTVTIQALQSHPSTGQVCVALSNGQVWTFHPVETDHKQVCYGRYRWRRGPVIDAAKIFYETTTTASSSSSNSSRSLLAPWNDSLQLQVSLAGDGKVLVSHRDQVAVFDGRESSSLPTSAAASMALAPPSAHGAAAAAELLWTAQLPGPVVTAHISGDGQAIAVVCQRQRSDTEDEEDTKAATDGVHTFERDLDDGSRLDDNGDEADLTNNNASPLRSRPKVAWHRNAASTLQSQGILYKPGPFLVHSAPVTRLAFRGYGTVTSSIVKAGQPGNDLLLTYCESDCTARIYGQNHWNPLTEWITSPLTRVEWVQCVSAFSLGDLESVPKPKRSASSSTSPVTSPTGNGAVTDVHETLSKRLHFSSSPQSAGATNSSSSHAGAWVVELCFGDSYPALRLFRLTYLERGVDDLNPTLLESISSYLPLNCLCRNVILSRQHGSLSIEGLWPAWNTWLSESTDLSVSGSAMASLGLLSGPATGLNGSLTGPQNPPSELRIVSSHETAGLVRFLDCTVFGDKGLTCFELRHPIRSVLSVSHYSDCATARIGRAAIGPVASRRSRRIRASLSFEKSSRLVAELQDDKQSVSITWRKPGTLSLLPANWLPDDVEPHKAGALLLNSSHTLRDESILPLPLVLPCVHLPHDMFSSDQSIDCLLWWQDSSCGKCPLLVAVLTDGTIVVFEIPPPLSSLEPPLPTYSKPPPPPSMTFDMNGLTFSHSFDDGVEDADQSGQDYEVSIVSDPEYGLGLRLESHADGMCAIAGSFKKHPLNGDTLPAEKSGLIRLGDELLSANDVHLEDMPFDDIVAAVREVGAACGPGNPMRLKFRRVASLDRQTSFGSGSALSRRQGSQHSDTSTRARRTMKQMLGVTADDMLRNTSSHGASRRHSRERHHTPDAAQEPSKVASSSVVSCLAGVFPRAISVACDSTDRCHVTALIPMPCGTATAEDQDRTALLLWAEGMTLVAAQLTIGANCEMKQSECKVLARHVLGASDASENEDPIRALCVISKDDNSGIVAACTHSGQVYVVSLKRESTGDTLDNGIAFQSYPAFVLNRPWCGGSIIQVHSSELLVTMLPNRDGICTVISIWSASPRPGRLQEESEHGIDESDGAKYCSSEISIEGNLDGDAFLEVVIISSGYMDAYPSLVAFSTRSATLYQRRGGSSDWLPATQILYNTTGWAGDVSSQMNCFGALTFLDLHETPCDVFPHLLPGLLTVTSSRDEEAFLRSDWHPDALIAYVCTDFRGAKEALNDGVSFVFNWLCSEGREMTEGYSIGSLLVAPVPVQNRVTNGTSQEMKPPSLLDALTAPQPESPKTLALDTLQREMLECLTKMRSPPSHTKRSGGFQKAEKESSCSELPAVLRAMSIEDLSLLWAVGEVSRSPPDFGVVDRPGQLFLFSSALFLKSEEITRQLNQQRLTGSRIPGVGRFGSTNSSAREPDMIASAGVLGALLSSNQVQIMKSFRSPNQKMSWQLARQHRISFWERSDAVLLRISEEIGQTIFRETRSSMGCALFFIISRKIRTLRNLAATDQTESGSKFSKFLSAHDFTSERGRRAAEKNAYSLLRKCRYSEASAFFLLAEPPFLNLALETISTKMQDADLAFLVARLMENAELNSLSNVIVPMGFSSLTMAGAGYAAVGPSSDDQETNSAEEHFVAWKPKLGIEAHKLLIDRILPASGDDNAMAAVTLLWLGKDDEASCFLSGHLNVRFAGLITYSEVNDTSIRFFERLMKASRPASSGEAISSLTAKANVLIDFASTVTLLESLHCPSCVRLAASYSVSKALSSRGLELASIRSLFYSTGYIDADDKENMDCAPEQNGFHISTSNDSNGASKNQHSAAVTRDAGQMQSSIFEEFDPPQVPTFVAPPHGSIRPSTTVLECSNSLMAQSSIFDDFDVRPPVKNEVQPHAVQSSIFDDFEMKPPVQKTLPPVSSVATGTIQSSIFDDFDVCPPTRKHTAPATDPKDGMSQSSIFDSFEVKPPTRNGRSEIQPNAAIGTMQSSIFDEYDTSIPQGNPITSPGFGKETGINVVSQLSSNDIATLNLPVKPNISLKVKLRLTPMIWMEWIENVLLEALARRLVRDVASVVASFQGEPFGSSIHDFFHLHDQSLAPVASEVLQIPCDPERFLGRIRHHLEELSNLGKVNSIQLVQRSISILGLRAGHRILSKVLLYAVIGRDDLGEETVRECASSLVERCLGFSLARDDLVQKTRTRAHVASQFSRREVARICWQLESCLWFHRGGGFSLSGIAFNEAIVAIRVGLLLAGWNLDFRCLEGMIESEPDCLTDDYVGRHLWMSLKVVDTAKADFGTQKASSGGWEFLVNCKRSQATELLRDRPTGCFIIRPHSEDTGVFTLSFKTNLIPELAKANEGNGQESESRTPDTSGDELDTDPRPPKRKEKKVRKEDVVQHAIIRLSDSGFRCGSFGPFSSLISLLDAVSSSLPFNLRFDLPPKNRVITEEGSQVSPNAILFRKLSLRHSSSNESIRAEIKSTVFAGEREQASVLGLFAQLVVLCRVRRQLSGVASFVYEDEADEAALIDQESRRNNTPPQGSFVHDDIEQFVTGSRVLGPFLSWCRTMEIAAVHELSPDVLRVSHGSLPVLDTETESSDNVTESLEAIEVSALHSERYFEGGDSILRGMIQQGSGVEFSTLRLVDAGECTMLVLFSRKEAVRWLVSLGIEQTDETAAARLDKMELDRVIEPVDLSLLPLKQKSVDPELEGVRYRFVDPWEVEALSNREGETRSASLGRGRFVGFSLAQLSMATDGIFRELGGDQLLELWSSAKGGVLLTKALAAVHPPWERAANGDLQLTRGKVTEPPPLMNSIRRCLYRNTLYRRLDLPQRFLALVQVELLDLKNLTSPGGSLSLTAYALLRLKRAGSGGTLTNKARTLDSAATTPVKLNKTSGPNAPASWGSLVRFRFPLPEDASVDGTSYDRDRESLFKGPPRVLQVSVYEKKLLADHSLGTADISTDSLSAGGQVEEWVPLRSEKRGITWFARIRLTLRFELMCLAPSGQVNKEDVPSVGLQRIYELNHSGGSAHEDVQKRSMSSPDLLSYFEGIVY
jgi:RAVE protein 1 C terminal